MTAGGVLFAANVDRVAAFYAGVLGLVESVRDDDHVLLESPAFQLVVHRLTGGATSTDTGVAEPASRRAHAAFKPVFVVADLADARARVSAHGGAMDPPDREWTYRGLRVCDAIDPEGNVIQFHERRTG